MVDLCEGFRPRFEMNCVTAYVVATLLFCCLNDVTALMGASWGYRQWGSEYINGTGLISSQTSPFSSL